MCLAKSVLASSPIYWMQSHGLPKSVCHQIDAITRNFIWSKDGQNKSWSMIGWEVLTNPKEIGGLGIRDMHYTDLAVLGKLIWSLIHEKHKLSVQVLIDKYMSKTAFGRLRAKVAPPVLGKAYAKLLTT